MEANYVDKIDLKAIIYGAIRGMMKVGDPDGSFMPPDVYKEMHSETQGHHAGVGLEITMRDDMLTVVAPIEGTPAVRAGIQPGDQIVKVDGESTKGMTLIDAVKRLRGPEGTPVTINVLRKGFAEPKELTLTRVIIAMKSVRWQQLPGDIGYIKLHSFQESTSDELNDALQEIEAQNIRALVLDLRNNAGGLLKQAIAVSNQFLEEGKLIVQTKGRVASQNMKSLSTNKHAHLDYPITVLVNKGSAAASEIVASALQDWKRATILGTRTFGKGFIQTIIPLSDGSGLRLTTAHYYTPQGHSIHGTGITPDIVVEPLTPEYSSFGDLNTDVQLQRAVETLRAQQVESRGSPPERKWNCQIGSIYTISMSAITVYGESQHIATNKAVNSCIEEVRKYEKNKNAIQFCQNVSMECKELSQSRWECNISFDNPLVTEESFSPHLATSGKDRDDAMKSLISVCMKVGDQFRLSKEDCKNSSLIRCSQE
jgi:carboxyl-terminal processing protease